MKHLLAALAILALAASASAQMGMPDPKQMSGMPLPMGEMTPGTVTVRVVRGNVTNIIPGQAVELSINGETKTSKTDESGRATFENLKIGGTVKVRAVVGSETLDSQEFQVPEQGGIRIMLVATDPNAEKEAAEAARQAAASAQPGTVKLGPQSRVHVELGEDAADVFYILDIANAQQTPVQPKTAFELELPEGATGSSVLEGSTPNATVSGRKVTVRGPFPPGSTMAQIAFRLPYSSGGLEFMQAFPAAADQPLLSVTKKLPSVRLSSASFHEAREMDNEGQVLLVAHASATPAGTPLEVKIEGVPTHPVWPRYLAVLVAGAVLAWGGYAAYSGPRRLAEKSAAARQLESRREKLLSDLAALEQKHRTGAVSDAQYDRRRSEIIEALERVYGDLDGSAAA
jgi:hypothetical protein